MKIMLNQAETTMKAKEKMLFLYVMRAIGIASVICLIYLNPDLPDVSTVL